MPNSATQNPANKVGRNSGAGAGGVSEIVPSQAEAQRGFPSTSSTASGGGTGGSGIGSLARLGVVGAVGAGIAALVTRRLRKPKGRRERLREWIGNLRK